MASVDASFPVVPSMTPSTSSLAPLRSDRIGAAGATLAAAFHDDPFFRHLFPRDASRRRWLLATMRASLSLVLPEGHVYTPAGAQGEAVIGLVPPRRFPLPAWRSIRFAARILARVPLGGFPLERIVWGVRVARAVERLHVRAPHCYVAFFGVHPSSQGQGLGRALLDPVLAMAGTDRVPTYLETTNERNLGFYRAFGFDVVKRLESPSGGPPVWTLLRPAPP